MPGLVAVLVLYKQTPEQSNALRALLVSPDIQNEWMTIVVYDNSPEPQGHFFQPFPFLRYVHDPSNGRLLAAYNYALEIAAQAQVRWLMLLDQDTEITQNYLDEARRLSVERLSDVCAFVPRLVVRGEQRSPHALHRGDKNDAIPTGQSRQRLTAWNSGAILSVAALRETGGFPSEFPLDNLDYATFFQLQAGKQRLYVMDSRIEHHLSVADLHTLSYDRLRDKLASDLLFRHRFHHKNRLAMSIDFLRTAISLFRKLSDKRMGLICLHYSLLCLRGE